MQTHLSVNSKVNLRGYFRRPQPSSSVKSPRPKGDYFNRYERQSGVYRVPVSYESGRAKFTHHPRIDAVFNRLQKSRQLPRIQFPVLGSDRIDTVSYTSSAPDSEEGSVWINDTQYFRGIPAKVWNWSLGGQQPCQKWLQARQHSTLCDHSIQQYQRIVTLLADMMTLMEQVDSVLQQQ
ncbi:type ISP restriction/modification enzyme [Leptolyngbya sp. AN03gr2]|uniref:type ISP restriction/modification enzyme n=1 Tax=unclassified Leptolyngbya TaxID=2650499 RepID=UPI003D321854